MGEDIPIDIHYQKLAGWLVSRNKIKPKWQSSLEPLKKQLEPLLLRLPDDLDFNLSAQECNYFDCKHVFEQLQERAQDSSKGWLGGFKDEQLESWAQLIRLYEKNNLYLGEAARTLERNTTYELPFMKKSVARNEKELKDLVRKEKSAVAGIQLHQETYDKSFEALGIPPKQCQEEKELRNYIKGSSKPLAKDLNEILRILQGDELGEALNYYCEFVEHFRGEPIDLVPTLKTIRENAVELSEEVETAPTANVDEVTVEDTGGDEVVWDLELASIGEEVDNTGEQQQDTANDDNGEIDWDWGVVEEVEQEESRDNVVEIVSSEVEKKESDDENDISLLNKNVRTGVQTDLMELVAFFQQRTKEVESSHQQGIPSSLDKNLAPLLEITKVTLDKLTDPDLLNLLLIQKPGAFLDRLVTQLRHKLLTVNKLKTTLNQIASKREELKRQSVEIGENRRAMVERTKQGKANVEAALQSMYSGRKVNIVGDINFI